MMAIETDAAHLRLCLFSCFGKVNTTCYRHISLIVCHNHHQNSDCDDFAFFSDRLYFDFDFYFDYGSSFDRSDGCSGDFASSCAIGGGSIRRNRLLLLSLCRRNIAGGIASDRTCLQKSCGRRSSDLGCSHRGRGRNLAGRRSLAGRTRNRTSDRPSSSNCCCYQNTPSIYLARTSQCNATLALRFFALLPASACERAKADVMRPLRWFFAGRCAANLSQKKFQVSIEKGKQASNHTNGWIGRQ